MLHLDEADGPDSSPHGTGALLDFVAHAGRTLGGLRDFSGILRRAAGTPIPMLADLVVIFAVLDGELQFEIAHRSPRDVARARLLLEARGDTLAAAVRRYPARAHWLRHVTPTALRRLHGGDGEFARLIEEMSVSALIVQPLTVRGQVWGALALARTDDRARYSAAEFAASSVLARRIALALSEVAVRTAAERAEDARARQEEAAAKWAHAFESAVWGAAILDPDDWRIESANPAFAELHGYDRPEELIGRAWSDFQAPEARRALEARIAEGDEGSVSIEANHVRRDGTEFPVLETVVTMRARGGRAGYRTAQVQDLSDLRRTEERLRGAQRLETVGRLAGGVAHEINNMMTVVLGFADFLSRDPALPPGRQSDVNEIQHAAERAKGITRELLAFSRKQVLQPEVLDASVVASESSVFLRSVLPANIELTLQVEPGAWVSADRTQLEQLLLNLTLNAKDAMIGGGTVRIACSVHGLSASALRRSIGVTIPAGQYTVLAVEDTGQGMDDATVARIFEPFFTTKSLGKGTGLGLASVYGIVKQSGGYITVTTAPGKGARFQVYLPLAAPPEQKKSAAPAVRAHGHETLLIAEDDDTVRRLTVRGLRDHGFQTLEAANGAAALELLSESGQAVDLVLSDLVMPVMDGRALRQRIAELGIPVPVLLMSAYTDEDPLCSGEPSGLFIQKPFTPSALAAKVREVLDAEVRQGR
ncbi:MAG TPA: ATP-binding protein [Gemmatimonadales bacterium]|nr:ATP-binding protein [Gemmatimonadales bacterium]